MSVLEVWKGKNIYLYIDFTITPPTTYRPIVSIQNNKVTWIIFLIKILNPYLKIILYLTIHLHVTHESRFGIC